MASKKNRICKVCNTEYNFCPNCSGVTATEKYRTMFCSKNCRDIFHTLSKLTVGAINKSETKEILSSLDLSNLDNFSETIKADVNEVMDINKKSFKKKIKEEPVMFDVIEPAIPVES